MQLYNALIASPEVWTDARARELVPILTSPVGVSTAGWPYLERPGWERLRDWVPVILDQGQPVLDAVERLKTLAATVEATDAELESFAGACRVVRQVVNTAAITAPPDLWLTHQVLASLRQVGLLQRLAAGEAIDPKSEPGLRAAELVIDLDLLMSRGYLMRNGTSYRASEHPTARQVIGGAPATESDHAPPAWLATSTDIEVGHALVDAVLKLRRAGSIQALLQAQSVTTDHPNRALFESAGTVDSNGALTSVGRRMLTRGPGPFGIIAAYEPYMQQLPQIWAHGRGAVHVQRGANVAASQDANHATFRRANDTLDDFCNETGWTWSVFIEHAIGRGEATRQRFERDGAKRRYFGADLEDAAIDAAISEQSAGRLPANMGFVRHADIGAPGIVIDAIRAAGADPQGAVMLVGNGLHEIRNQSDENMIAVFKGYEEAGLVLLFTEENALSTEDLLATAWNTYHSGFRYVHARSGQGLRPAVTAAPSALGPAMRTSWSECAERAGYVRLERWCSRRRTIYPYTPVDGHNPSISTNHFIVPRRIAAQLGLL